MALFYYYNLLNILFWKKKFKCEGETVLHILNRGYQIKIVKIVYTLCWTALNSPSHFSKSKSFFLLSPAAWKRNKNLQETKNQLISSQYIKKRKLSNKCMQDSIVNKHYPGEEDAESHQYKFQKPKKFHQQEWCMSFVQLLFGSKIKFCLWIMSNNFL